ncbi:Maf family protein [Suttonella sp. R2A3]|uniref:Maf family protein n=1 Tax=Suttonella sp. R2A3 TaxID=2908648 RepID=UPI001F22176E|nr:Maf family protein [Suttonella sp. R2A3]UJF24211.1 Maf family protein [Suttonella sp. R2A3]
MNLVLASQSPRRRDLLTMLGVSFTQCAAEVDETVAQGVSLEDSVRQLAERKASAVAGRYSQDQIILAADTLVGLDDRLFGKPADDAEALSMLRSLAGRTHRVATGFCLRRGDEVYREVVCTQVTMMPADEALFAAYIASGEPFGKAGAYAVQGRGAALIEAINGDFFNVVGLPVHALVRRLRQMDEMIFLQAFSRQLYGDVQYRNSD